MDDTITIEECITRLDTIRHDIVPDSRDHFALSAGIAALYEMENDNPVNRWVPVEDALPEEYEKAREYWCRRLERAENYSDEHWDAEERHAHRDYIDAMTHAITALAICREKEQVKQSQTNADKIRRMSDDELAEFMDFVISCCSSGWRCNECPLKNAGGCNKEDVSIWLKQEAECSDHFADVSKKVRTTMQNFKE